MRTGFLSIMLTVCCDVNAQHNDSLRQDTINEIIVSSHSPQQRINELQIGAERLELETIQQLPMLFGEKDFIKGIQMLPGIKNEGDGLSGFQVRGGTSAQNLVLLDGAPIYNTGHLMGLFSAFNGDAIGRASLYKGLMPPHWGGGSSSVLELNTRSGDTERHHFGFDIGLLSARAEIDGPLNNNGSTYLISARHSFLNLFIKASDKYSSNTLRFSDMNAKLSFRLSPKDRLDLTFFRSSDVIEVENLFDMSWENMALNLHWHHSFSPSHTMKTQLVASNFQNDTGIEVYHLHYGMKGHIRPITLRHQHSLILTKRCLIDIGLEETLLSLQSADWTILQLREREQRHAWQQAGWTNLRIQVIPSKLDVSAGLRIDCFSALGGKPYYHLDNEGNITDTLYYRKGSLVKTYVHLEPRLSLNWRISSNYVLRAGYSRTTQPIQAIRNSSMTLPFDRYTMASNIIHPQVADQISAGWATLLNEGAYDLSAEAYYKRISHVYDYRDGKSFQSAIEIESLLAEGKGRAYGLELCGRKNTGRLKGWLAYTLSWSENLIDGINDGQWYTATHDRRHDLSIVAIYQMTPNWLLTSSWRYTTGQAMTPPYAKYEIDGDTYYYYAKRNELRAPAFHRLDLGLTYTKQMRRFTRIWNFGFYNAYCHYNPFMVYFKEVPAEAPVETRATVTSLLSIIPYISLTMKY